MHLIDGKGRGKKVCVFSLFHPHVVLPHKAGDIGSDGGSARAVLSLKGVRVGLKQHFAAGCGDGVLVQLACAKAGNKYLVDA